MSVFEKWTSTGGQYEQKIYAAGIHIATVWCDTIDQIDEITQLIVCAPDLLRAAKKVCNSEVIKTAPFSNYSNALSDLRAAIAKAEGKK